jgi:WD40 repeat protein
VLDGLYGDVWNVSFSADGARVATMEGTSVDNEVSVWDVASGRLVFRRRHGYAAAISGGGMFAAVLAYLPGDLHGRIEIWDLEPVRLVRTIVPRSRAALSLDLSDDGSRIAVGLEGGAVRIWDVRAGPAPIVFQHGSADVGFVSFSPNGRRLVAVAAAPDDRTPVLWDPRTGRLVAVLAGHVRSISSVRFALDGKLIVTGGDKTARVWRSRDGRLVSQLRGHPDWVNDARLNADGSMVVTTSADGTARVWNTASGGTVADLRGHDDEVITGVFRAGQTVETVSRDRSVRVWDISTGHALRDGHEWILDAAFSRDANRVATAGADAKVRVWSAGRKLPIAVLRGHTAAVDTVAFSVDGSRLVSADESGRAIVWSLGARGGEADSRLEEPANTMFVRTAITGASFDETGSHVLTSSFDGTARVWNLRTRKAVTYGKIGDPVLTGAAYSPDHRLIVTADVDGVAKIWRVGHPTRPFVVLPAGATSRLAGASFSPDGALVATTSWGGTTSVWDWRRRTVVAKLPEGARPAGAPGFSRDGNLLVTASAEGTTHVWDWRAGRLLAVLRMHADAVNDAQFSPRSDVILSASDDGTARIYRCEACGPISQVRDVAERRLLELRAR